jgi:DNA-binding transcriptional ArsR family regulator
MASATSHPETTKGPSAATSPELRRITDARTLRALAHPVRIALLEALKLHGSMTATQAGEAIAESPTTCSFHLRQLARYGFVEEAGGGKGRARPWRMVDVGLEVPSVYEDLETELAATTLSRLVRERQLNRHRAWLEAQSSYPREWREAAGDGEFLLYVTPGELKALNDELVSMLMSRFADRIDSPERRPAGSAPVELLVFSYPIAVPSRS